MAGQIAITFSCGNAAFDGNAEEKAEAAGNVLRTCAQTLRYHWLHDDVFPINDANGNRIGEMTLSGFDD